MADMTYYPEVRCEVLGSGIVPDGVTARVEDLSKRSQFVQVTREMICWYGEEAFLPVGFVEVDYQNRRVLIELPAEADSGANRMWVAFESLRRETLREAEIVR
jgi:hypothetical protein